MIEHLKYIPFTLDTDNLIRQARLDPDSGDAAALRTLADVAQTEGRPKAIVASADVSHKTPEQIVIDDVPFRSRMLARLVRPVERVFPYLVTCGRELDDGLPPDARGDILREYLWDLIKTDILNQAARFLADHVRSTYRIPELISMNPGSGDADVWPLEQQRGLFSLFHGAEKDIGVTLTDTCLMIPNKTLSGLFIPSRVAFESCEVCRRRNCPSRSAPFDERLWLDLHGPTRPPNEK